jgi:hypothetical protein
MAELHTKADFQKTVDEFAKFKFSRGYSMTNEDGMLSVLQLHLDTM